MKILTIIYRWVTLRCGYCGNKLGYDLYIGYFCPTDMEKPFGHGCATRKKFIRHKEAEIQRALGLLSGPKGF